MLLLGSVYAWGVFRVETESTYQISASLSGLPYMTSLVSYAVTMLIAGKWMNQYRKQIVMLGVVLFVSGFWFQVLQVIFMSLF